MMSFLTNTVIMIELLQLIQLENHNAASTRAFQLDGWMDGEGGGGGWIDGWWGG